MWGYLKSKVNINSVTDLQAHKENMREEIARLSEETFQDVMRNFVTRVHMCIEEVSGHLKDIVHKNVKKKKKKISTIVNFYVLKFFINFLQ
jgi:predicted translin family RNA/ssDNA-binding protein